MSSLRSKSASPTRRLSYDLKSVKINDLVDKFDNIPLLMSKLHAHQANKRRYSILGMKNYSLIHVYGLLLLTYTFSRSSTQSVFCNGRITDK